MFTIGVRAKNIDQGRTLVAAGFRVLEITLPCPGGEPEFEAWLDLGRSGQASFLGHGPEEGDPTDIGSLESVFLPKLKRALEQASRLGCPLLTIHFWLDSRFLPPEVIESKIELLRRVTDWGKTLDVLVNMENLSESHIDLGRALEAVPGLGITLDVGHAQILSDENTAPAIIDHLFPRIRHLHLHDNHGGNSPRNDLHLPPGQGIVPFDAIFERLRSRGYQGTGTLELGPDEVIAAQKWVEAAWAKAGTRG